MLREKKNSICFTVCKKGKKIMMNLFGSTEDMKKKLFFFCSLTVARTKEKKNDV